MASVGKAALTAACLYWFGRVFGEDAKYLAGTFLKDSTADPPAATSADRIASIVRWLVATRELAAWMQHLVVAGRKADTPKTSYLAGAVVAAKLAVERTLAALVRRPPHDEHPVEAKT